MRTIVTQIIYLKMDLKLTPENKIAAINYLNNLETEVHAAINPWNDICNSLESEYVGQLIMSSA